VNKNNLHIVSEMRTQILGLSVLAIILYHYKMVFFGELGVDVFIFLSGFGLACGYGGGEQRGRFFSFLAKRLLRIIPAYWFILIAYVTYSLVFTERQYNLTDVLLNLSCLQMFFVGFNSIVPHAWYLSLIVVMYLFFPLFIRFVKMQKALYLLVGVYVFIAIEYFSVNLFPIAIFRVPTFIAGIWLGFLYISGDLRWQRIIGMRNQVICLTLLFGALISLAAYFVPADLLWNPDKYWTVVAVFSPVLSTAFVLSTAYCLSWCNVFGLDKVGICSYEMYLTHQLLYDFLYKRINSLAYFEDSSWIPSIFIVLVVFVSSYILHLSLNVFVGRFVGRSQGVNALILAGGEKNRS